ncbi:PPE domain-containing protein, partial [Mycobacterium kansasii]
SFESVCSGLADRWWQGPSSRMMAAQAARHTGWLAAAATQAEGAASQAQTMALAYEAAFAATVHPALVAANRALVAWLAGSNVFG